MSLASVVDRTFRERFLTPPSQVVLAPGRVNLIGEHTDYNDGFVLPCAIDFGTYVAAGERDDDMIHVLALDYEGQESSFSVSTPIPRDPEAPWADYVRGVVEALTKRGHAPKGANLVISGNVPQGAGLSSSASLEVAVALTLSELFGFDLSAAELAHVGQDAENHYVGCQCGIMDQLASAAGLKDHATLIDCRSLEVKPVPLPDDVSIVIINSNVRRGLVDSEYNARRSECEEGARLLGVRALRDATMPQLEAAKDVLTPQVYRRARHVISENTRTESAAAAMRRGDIATLSQLMAESHASLKDDFEVTVPALNILVDLVDGVMEGHGGARMTGGGFGGCIVALSPKDRVDAIRDIVEAEYESSTGLRADIFVCQPSEGARALTSVEAGPSP